MAETITLSQIVQIGSGIQLTTSSAIAVDAYDVVEVEIADAAADVEVQVQPAAAPGLLKVLAITASAYDPDLTYKVNAAAAPAHALDAPQVFAGDGAVALLDANPPTALFLSNATGAAIKVKILAGRDATP
jgi:hypothetical protein